MAPESLGSSFLIVDDAPTVRRRARAMLNAAGVPDDQITETEDARQGLQAFRDQQPDVVLLDIMLPGLPGGEVGAIMMAERPEAHVALMTGLEPSHDDVRHLLSQGAVDVLEKPIRGEDIRQLLKLLDSEYADLGSPGEAPA